METDESLLILRSLLEQFEGPKAVSSFPADGVSTRTTQAAFALPWPTGSVGPIDFRRGVTALHVDASGETSHDILAFAVNRDTHVTYGLDLLEAKKDVLELSVWSVEPSGQELTNEGTLDEVLSEWLDGTAFDDDSDDD